MERWARVCKEPDDPCTPTQCDTWCKRHVGNESVGYCVNSVPDESCQLHHCICDDASECGGRDQPCCTTGNPCRSSSDECGGQTGTCVEKDSQVCDEAPADTCQRLMDYCPTCDLADNRAQCEAGAASGNPATCQQTFENILDFCYPTSAYCESLRRICETCTDDSQRLNCIAASSSQYAYENPALCTEFDISARGSCQVP